MPRGNNCVPEYSLIAVLAIALHKKAGTFEQ